MLLSLVLPLSLLISRHHPINAQCMPSTLNGVTIWLVGPYPLQMWMLHPLTLISKMAFLRTCIHLDPGVRHLGPEATYIPCRGSEWVELHLRTSDAFTAWVTACTVTCIMQLGMEGWSSMNLKRCPRNRLKRILTGCLISCGDTAKSLPDISVEYDAGIVIIIRDVR